MSCRRYEIIERTPSPFFISHSQTFSSLNPFLPSPSLFPFHDVIPGPTTLIDPLYDVLCTDLHINTYTLPPRFNPSDFYLQTISDRVSSLESKLDRLFSLKQEKVKKKLLNEVGRKYTWTAEIKGGGSEAERKYKWTADIEKDDLKKGKTGERKYQFSTELKGRDDEKRIYTWKATIGADKDVGKKKKKEKKSEKKGSDVETTRIVEIDEVPSDHKSLLLRQAFAKRAAKNKGKGKELSPLDAATLIQMSFRAYLIRRSQALRALRELAVAKTKLKELRALFHNFSYRNRVARDAEERQKYTEKIIVLLLTVDAIEGADMMVRAAKRSMIDELEAMLDVVDPQPGGRHLSLRRRTFDMPSGTLQKEIAEGVAQVVQMLDQENGTFEACV